MKSDLNYDQKPLKILSSRNWATDDHCDELMKTPILQIPKKGK